MGLAYSSEDGLATVVGEGSFGVEEIRATFSDLRSEFEPASRVRILIVDHASEFDPSHEEIRELVDVWAALFQDVSARIALLVERELHYGFGRMAAAHAERLGLPFRVFRYKPEAVVWLSEPD